MQFQTLHFGTKFDSPSYHPMGEGQFLGEKKLLLRLETLLGFEGYPHNTEYLRIELYRQALQELLVEQPEAFFAKSFEADRFATATTLLTWRDDLILAGWSPDLPNQPARLACLATAEVLLNNKRKNPRIAVETMGFADRFAQVLQVLPERELPFERVVLHEPVNLLPVHIQRLIEIFKQKKIAIEMATPPQPIAGESNLTHLQMRLCGQTQEQRIAVADDASLLILRHRRDADAATFLAQTLGKNPQLQPVFILPEMSLTLERSLVKEGFPAMGVLSASLARPSLQALKLAPVFLWEPVDIFKIMEFATLPLKPLEDGLAAKIAEAIATKPGLFNDTWFAMIFGYLEDENTPEIARKDYEFWFNRRRYRAENTAPKRDVVGIYTRLQEWASDFYEKNGSKNPSLLVLAEQARRIRELLETLPEPRLTFLELERIVRTIYEPAPVQFHSAEKNHFQFVHTPGAVAAPAKCLIWWNCIHNEPAPSPLRWQPEEIQFFENQGIKLIAAKEENALRLLLRNRAVLATQEKLVLVVPENIDGASVEPHLLLGDIEAAFKQTEDFNFHLENEFDRKKLQKLLALPALYTIQMEAIRRVPPILEFDARDWLLETEYETLTNLESLFYYPHKWFFQKKMRLFPSSVLSVPSDQTLTGTLAHRFFELMLKENFFDWEKSDVHQWIAEKATELLEREAASMLMYGREPERNRFLNRLKNAAWVLISILKKNNWQVVATEKDLDGTFCEVQVRGKADLVLQRGNEFAILDLKWGGANYRKSLIQNGADLQLVFYSKLLPPETQWAHTAYFILEDAKLIARNTAAFAEAQVAGVSEDHNAANELIFSKMEKTFRWRMAQMQRGHLEIRNEQNRFALDELYAEQLLDLLELPTTSATFDDYRTLIGV